MGKLLSFDPKKYSPWQRRTFYCCAFMFLLSVVLATVGVVFVVLAEFFGIKSIDLMPGVVLGGETLVAGIVGIVVALSGIIGAKDPRKITLFFWIVTLYGLLELWDLASKISQGQVNPAAIITLVIVMFLVACAWNVRGQTGYFDNHPHPGDPEQSLRQRFCSFRQQILLVDQPTKKLTSAKPSAAAPNVLA